MPDLKTKQDNRAEAVLKVNTALSILFTESRISKVTYDFLFQSIKDILANSDTELDMWKTLLGKLQEHKVSSTASAQLETVLQGVLDSPNGKVLITIKKIQ